MFPSTMLTSLKQYSTSAVFWALMVIITAFLSVLMNRYFIPSNIGFITHTNSEKNATYQTNYSEEYGIKQIINAVRKEIIAAQDEIIQKNEAALFQMETFDIELSFVVSHQSAANLSVDVPPKFLVIGADTDYKKEQVQKIVLHFSVLKPTEPINGEIVKEIFQTEDAIDLNSIQKNSASNNSDSLIIEERIK